MSSEARPPSHADSPKLSHTGSPTLSHADSPTPLSHTGSPSPSHAGSPTPPSHIDSSTSSHASFEDSEDGMQESEELNDIAPGGIPLTHGFLKWPDLFSLYQSHCNSNLTIHDKVPIGRKENVYFVVDDTKNIERRDRGDNSVFWDDCGTWNSRASTAPTTYYCINDEDKFDVQHIVIRREGKWCREKQIEKKRKFIPLEPQPQDDELLHVFRHYSKLKSPPPDHEGDTPYSRRITWISALALELPNIAIYEYVNKYPTGEAIHGNSRVQRNYVRPLPEVMQEIKSKVQTGKPRKVYSEMLLNASDPMFAPGDKKQIENQRYILNSKQNPGKKSNVADHLEQVLQNLVHDKHSLVQSVLCRKGQMPHIVIYSMEQIADITRFCCSDVGDTTVLGVDKTYNLGPVHVTALAFKNIALVNSRGEHPIFPGPMLTHDKSDHASFFGFFSVISEELRKAPKTPQMGGDGEIAMQQGAYDAFQKVKPLLTCTEHLKSNSRSKLRDGIGVADRVRNEILRAIFGENGLSTADSEALFEVRQQVIEEICAEKAPEFLSYFKDTIVPKLHLNMVLGYPNWMNNNSESLNHVMKIEVNWEPQPLLNMITMLEKLIKVTYEDVERSLYGMGNYRLAPEFAKFYRKRTTWANMSKDQQSKLKARFLKTPKIPLNRSVSSNGLVVPTPTRGGKKPSQRKRKKAAKTTSLGPTRLRIRFGK